MTSDASRHIGALPCSAESANSAQIFVCDMIHAERRQPLPSNTHRQGNISMRTSVVVATLVVLGFAAGGAYYGLEVYPQQQFRAGLDQSLATLPPGTQASYQTAHYLAAVAQGGGHRTDHPRPNPRKSAATVRCFGRHDRDGAAQSRIRGRLGACHGCSDNTRRGCASANCRGGDNHRPDRSFRNHQLLRRVSPSHQSTFVSMGFAA